MKIIIPMAGMGKRMRPHTLTIPKPLIPIAGKPIVQRLVEDLIRLADQPVDEIAFVIGDFGKDVEDQLLKIAKDLGAKGLLYYQKKALGTAHAILCAKDVMEGNIIIAFADTLFIADFTLNTDVDGIIWVQKIDDPSHFGVVKTDGNNIITDFVEKPDTFVSNKAIIGIYYIKKGERLREELQYLIDNNVKDKGEYQLTNGLENMKQKGSHFSTQSVTEWLDCGNKDSTVFTNQRILELEKDEDLISNFSEFINSKIDKPCFVGKNVTVKNSIIGPHVSIGENTVIENAVIKNSIILTNSKVRNEIITNSMIGNFVDYCGHENKSSNGPEKDLNIGDFTTIK